MSLVLSIAGVDKTGILKAKTLSIKRRAEGRNECSFTLLTPYASYNPPIGADVIVSSEGLIVFGGIIKERRLQRLELKGIMYCQIRIFCQGYNHIPKRRTIQYNPDGVTAGAAVRHMLGTVLSQEGIQEGVIEEGMTLHNYIASCKSVRDILDDLADACGFKWYIDDQKALYFLKEDTAPAAPFSLLESGSFTDFSEVEVEDSFEGYRNKQFVKSGDTIAVVENKAEITSRIAIEGGTGVYGDVYENSTVQTTADAQSLADDLLNRYGQHIPSAIAFVTYTPGFDAGQRLQVELPSLGASGAYLIETVDISDMGNSTLKYSVTAVKKNFEKTSKRKADWVDYFECMLKGGAAASTDSLEGVQTYINAEALAVSSTQIEGMKISASTSRNTHIYVGFTLAGSASADNALLTAVLQCNGTIARTYKQVLKQGYNVVSATTVIAALPAGAVSIRLLLVCEGGVFDIDANYHDGYIRAIGLADTPKRLPEAFVALTITRDDVATAAESFDIGFPDDTVNDLEAVPVFTPEVDTGYDIQVN